MKKQYYLLSFLFILSASLTFAEPSSEEKTSASPEKKASLTEEENTAKISEAFGHLIGKNIETLGVKFDIARVVKGLEDAMAGKGSPMTEEECVYAITTAQEEIFKEQAAINLKKADEFMAHNANDSGIKIIEKGKLHYKVEQEGKGVPVQAHFSPMIRYTGKYLDGTIFGSSKEEELISLDETIPGFTKGLIGMKEGEKRILYIHPELAYGTSGYLPPNSLLQFEIELVKANVPPTQNEAISSKKSPSTGVPEQEAIETQALR